MRPTLLCWRVAVGEEAEVALVVPADQRQAALHHHPRLAALRRRGAAHQHVLGQTSAVALPGAQEAAAVDVCRGEDEDTDGRRTEAKTRIFRFERFPFDCKKHKRQIKC